MSTYYDILGISPYADDDAIKDAYRKKAKEFHPDLNNGTRGDLFIQISKAFDILSNPFSRTKYDLSLKLKEQLSTTPNTQPDQNTFVGKRQSGRRSHIDEYSEELRKRYRSIYFKHFFGYHPNAKVN
jgi:curved DNA-binding protein CbpA